MKIFIDEAGQTGSDIMVENQPFFVLAGVMLNEKTEPVVLQKLEEIFNRCRENEEIEIKGSKWSKSAKKSIALQTIIEEVLNNNGHIAIVIVEKRFMAGCIVIDNFFDYVYNDVKDPKWVNCKDTKIQGANYFVERMNDDLAAKVWDAFRKPHSVEIFQSIVNELLLITDNTEYRLLLEGAKPHIEELVKDLFQQSSEHLPLDDISTDTMRAPNFSSFNSLVNMLIPICHLYNQPTELIMDEQHQFTKAHQHLFEIFHTMKKPSVPLGSNGVIYSWNAIITGLTVADSKVEKGLQLADIIASSMNSLMVKAHKGDMKKFLELDLFNIALLHFLDNNYNTVQYAISRQFCKKYYEIQEYYSKKIAEFKSRSAYIRNKMK